MLPKHDQTSWNNFAAEWGAASPFAKMMILGRKLGLLLLLLAVIVGVRWMIG